MRKLLEPASWPWTAILYACLALLALAVALAFFAAPGPACETDAECEALFVER
jgi:hypothetical protein